MRTQMFREAVDAALSEYRLDEFLLRMMRSEESADRCEALRFIGRFVPAELRVQAAGEGLHLVVVKSYVGRASEPVIDAEPLPQRIDG